MSEGEGAETVESSQRVARLLVIAAESVHGQQVLDEISRRVDDGTEVRLVAPALAESSLESVMGDVDHGRELAGKRLEESQRALAGAGINATGEIGDADLHLAIQDALQTFEADEVVIVAHSKGGPVLEKRGIEESEHDIEPPITELYVSGEGSGATVTEVEHVGPGPHPLPGDRESRSGNLPRFSPRDIAGILVAIVGTLVLVFLAAGCDDGDTGTEGFNHCSAQLLIAGAVGLVNLAHIVGLAMFQAGSYRGVFEKLFANLSLFGTPLAILVFLFLIDG